MSRRTLLAIVAWIVLLIAAVTAASTISENWLAYVVIAVIGIGAAWAAGWEWLVAIAAIIAIAFVIELVS